MNGMCVRKKNVRTRSSAASRLTLSLPNARIIRLKRWLSVITLSNIQDIFKMCACVHNCLSLFCKWCLFSSLILKWLVSSPRERRVLSQAWDCIFQSLQTSRHFCKSVIWMSSTPRSAHGCVCQQRPTSSEALLEADKLQTGFRQASDRLMGGNGDVQWEKPGVNVHRDSGLKAVAGRL